MFSNVDRSRRKSNVIIDVISNVIIDVISNVIIDVIKEVTRRKLDSCFEKLTYLLVFTGGKKFDSWITGNFNTFDVIQG